MMHKVLSRLMLIVILVGSSFLTKQTVPNLIGNAANAQSGNNASGVVNASDGFNPPLTRLNYQRQTGRCVNRDVNGRVIQDISSCRKTWYAIVRAGSNEILFYDRDAGDIEIYDYTNGLMGERLLRWTGSARKTWRDIRTLKETLMLNPGQRIFYHIQFTDDNGERQVYRYSRSTGLVR